jgi:hypothetical protein
MSQVEAKVIAEKLKAKFAGEEIDQEFLQKISDYFENELSNYYIYDTPQQTGGDAPVEKKKKKKQGSRNMYNFYVSDKKAEYKEKGTPIDLAGIGNLWKQETPEVKEKYKKIADEWKANHPTAETATETATVTST